MIMFVISRALLRRSGSIVAEFLVMENIRVLMLKTSRNSKEST